MTTATKEEHAGPMGAIQDSLSERYERLPIAQLVESKLNPRKTFDPAKLNELTASIREKGVIEPLVVRQVDAGSHKPMKFEIIAGARRFRGATLAGLTHVPTIIRMYTDTQAIEIMAIENGQRDDVPALEEAAGYKQLLLVDQTYTAAMIATKIGRPEKFVWDRLRLLELVPELQAILAEGEIGVEHAELLAKLKPADQRDALKLGTFHKAGGLFEFDGATDFDENPKAKKRKPVSVRQLKQWIAEHVRLDLKHAAAAAPLEFGDTAQQVEAALAEPGRGKKVIPITFSHMCPDGAKDKDERTYGSTAWKKAENKDRQPTCDYAVLGLVVAGEHYGQSFHVCINRDKCTTHWKESVQAKEKAAKLRAGGKTKQAAKVEQGAADREERRRNEERLREEVETRAWTAAQADFLTAVLAKVKSLSVPSLIERVVHRSQMNRAMTAICGKRQPKTADEALRVLALDEVIGGLSNSWKYDRARSTERMKKLGVDAGAILKQHTPKPAAPAAGKKKSKAA